MALPGTPGGGQQISMSQINTELGRSSTASISLDTAENGGYAAINTCSQYYPLAANPATMNEWHGYNHTAVCLTSFTMYYYNTGDGYYGGTSATQACNATYTYTVYASTSTIGNGTRLYYNSNGTGEVEGSNNTSYYWFKIDGYSFSYTQGSGNGIANYTACSTVTYNHYTADKYQCSTCTLVSSGVIVSFPDTESVTINNWYPDGNDIYHSYQIIGTYSDGPGYILTNAYGSYTSCSVACSI